jgi:hypothetical protein
MKETFYFTHDYNARQDPKIKNLIRKHGILGYGIFWAIVEDLYQNANALRLDCECIAFDLRTDCELVESIIKDFDLFVIKDGYFGSLSVQRRTDERDARSSKARISAFARWNKDANAMRTHSDRNAIKERKEKEIKEKENKINNIANRQIEFFEELKNHTEKYGKEMVRKFYDYWSEKTTDGQKMRKEMEKTWETEKRLAKWKSNNFNNNNKIENAQPEFKKFKGYED